MPANASKIYKWVLPDGSISYSDRPQQQGAQEMELPPLQLYTPAPLPPSPAESQGGDADQDAAVAYELVRIASPQPDETIRDNSGNVSVQVELRPALQAGHTVEILFNGSPIGSGAATTASLTNVDRGSHTVSAVVKDASGKVLASAPGVTFHLKQASRLFGGGSGGSGSGS